MINRYITSLLLALCLMTIAAPCRCQDSVDKGAIYSVQGEITSVDTIQGVITLRWMESFPVIATKEIVLKVPQDLQIAKGAETIGVLDINQFDRAMIQYRMSKAGELPVVVSMTIEPSD
ncbi:MAG: hypothetical protein PHX20_03615 [Candidatus Omnitrophica bacterium]|nr:hypothetical protein [Candidatus Omnitrophota bacterium]MDD5436612.1 hypothetical protein [Candidatus Omnitrophota bacterium]